jgi:hypothetical protein
MELDHHHHHTVTDTTEKPRPLRIDIHTHILPRNWPDLAKKYGYGGWVQLEHSTVDPVRLTTKENTPIINNVITCVSIYMIIGQGDNV